MAFLPGVHGRGRVVEYLFLAPSRVGGTPHLLEFLDEGFVQVFNQPFGLRRMAMTHDGRRCLLSCVSLRGSAESLHVAVFFLQTLDVGCCLCARQ